MTTMRVWQANHNDGSPRKTWAVAIDGSRVFTRYASFGVPLRKPDYVNMNGAGPSARLAAMEREKQQSGYQYLGEMDVDDDGNIFPVAPLQRSKPTGFFSLKAQVSKSILDKLNEVGFNISIEGLSISVEYEGEQFSFNCDKAMSINSGIRSELVTPIVGLVMIYLAKFGNSGVVVGATGEVIPASFEGLLAWKGSDAEPLREIAELLNVANRPLFKSLKQQRSGLFEFRLC